MVVFASEFYERLKSERTLKQSSYVSCLNSSSSRHLALLQGLDSTESLIESLTFQSTASSAGELGPQTSSPLTPAHAIAGAPQTPIMLEDVASVSTRQVEAEAAAAAVAAVVHQDVHVFADWQWLPAMPLIAHEGGVGVGVIPLY